MARKAPKNLPNPEAVRVIDALGGQTAVSSTFGLTQQAVSLWTYKGIPRAWRGLIASLHPGIFDPDTRAGDRAEAGG